MKHLLPATTHDIKYFSFDANIDVGSTIIKVATNIATCCTCKKTTTYMVYELNYQ